MPASEMEEDLADYLHMVKNDPALRDQEALQYIGEIKAIHDDVFENGINGFQTTINTLLLSYFERISYYDPTRKSYDSYARYADFLNCHPKRQTDYEANAAKEKEDGYPGVKGALEVLSKVAQSIPDPNFRIFLILLTVCLFKDEGPLTKRQKDFLATALLQLQIKE
jgi:hypothetical protein